MNFKIIQSDHGISMDQTDHIVRMLKLYFVPDHKPSKTDTPLCTNKQFNLEILQDNPATAQGLKALLKEYIISFTSVYGDISHIATASRPDLCNAMSHLGVFQAAPSTLSFSSLHRIMIYLKTHPNVPLSYPNKPLTSTLIFEAFSSTGDSKHHLSVPHCLCSHVDSSFVPHANRHSVSGHVKTIGTVDIDWKTEKQVTCASSSSNSKVRSHYSGEKHTIKKRQFLQQLSLLLLQPTPLLTSLQTSNEKTHHCF